MLNQQTMEKLYAMRLRAMADASTNNGKIHNTGNSVLKKPFALLVDRQWNWR